MELCPVDHALDACTFVYPGRPDPPDLDLEVAVADEPAVRAFALATVPTGTDDEDLPNARPLRLGLSVSLGSRQAVRHVGAALGLEAPRVNGLARLVPLLSSPGAIEDVLTRAPEIGIADLSPNAEPYNTVLTVATRLEGLPQRYGPHPSGLAVAPEGGPSMLRWLPGQWVSSPRSSNFRGRHTPVTMQPQAQSEPSDGLAHLNGLGLGLEQPALVCQWDRDDLAALGIPKLDISPSVALATVNAEAAQPASPEAATAAWRMIEAGDTLCINQAETVGLRMLFKRATDALQALGADGRAIGSVEELAQLLALWRPGAYSQERAESYFAVKFGAEQPAYAHPSMAAVLDPTYGQVLYAEQIAELVELLGFDHAWAERFRRALATGRALERDAMERDLRKVASARQWTDAQTNALIALLVEHSGLLFKHGHALALAQRAYQQAQRKVDPGSAAAWFAACLSAGGSQYGLGAAAEEARRFGVILLPPCVNRSGQAFVAELGAPELQAAQEKGHGVVGAVRVPLAAIRGLSQDAVGHILSVRAAYGAFMGLLDFLRKADHRFVSRNDVLLLLKLGAFGFTGLSRAQLTVLEHICGATADLLRGVEADPSGLGSVEDIFSSQFARVLEVEEWAPEVLAAYDLAHLGFYVSAPLAVQEHARRLAEEWGALSIAELVDYPDRTAVTVGAIVTALRVRKTKKGERMAWLTLADGTGAIEGAIFPKPFRSAPALREGVFLVARGRLSHEEATGPKLLIDEVHLLSGKGSRLSALAVAVEQRRVGYAAART